MIDFDKIIGLNMNELEFSPLYRGDLQEFEGPILSHYIDRTQKNYLMYFLGIEGKYSVWVLFDVSVTTLFQYLSRKKSLKEIFKEEINSICHIVWSDSKGKHKRYKISNIKNIPVELLPRRNSYFEIELSNSYYKELKIYLKNSLEEKKHIVETEFLEPTLNLDPIYRSYRNDNNVFKARLISQLMTPLIKHEKARYHFKKNIIDLMGVANYIDQDPFGNLYSDILEKSSQNFNLSRKGKDSNRQYNDLVFYISKELGNRILDTKSVNQRKEYLSVYVKFVSFVHENNLNIDFHDITEHPKVKLFIKEP